MAIKQRVLKKLNTIEQHILHAMKEADGNVFSAIGKDLETARNLCLEGLPRDSYAPYEEIYDGMILAVQKMVAEDTASSQKEALVMCRELLQYILMQTEQEKKFKKEIVFLPYKASMWDSLESVWKAAYEDKEHCNAYVMPIPYADLTPERSAAEWHCERDQFPRYVPTIDWKKIDLKAWHPDVIFYHNPYDDCNLVTSVESRYYSRNLKECTDKLVYIPYFVLGEPQYDYDDPEKKEEIEKAEENIAHFITTPGVISADLTIVQSEAMKKVYVNVLNRHTNAPAGYWEEHISGLGSPKFDKVAASSKEDFELPDEWNRIIRGRKTVLYNTGLSAMLEHTDKYLKKIHSVLATFKAHDDVVLWWRPHPLLRATFESMHPELLEEYDEIVSAYRQEGWGIYDDTAELERAVAWTDGYYGDMSSVVHLYEKTGKLVMIQHVADSEEEDVTEEAKEA